MVDLPSEDEIRAVVRLGLSGLGEPPPVVVDALMRQYFETWAKSGLKDRADRWLADQLRAMVTP